MCAIEHERQHTEHREHDPCETCKQNRLALTHLTRLGLDKSHQSTGTSRYADTDQKRYETFILVDYRYNAGKNHKQSLNHEKPPDNTEQHEDVYI